MCARDHVRTRTAVLVDKTDDSKLCDTSIETVTSLSRTNMRMLNADEESDDAPEVTWEDQQRINTFSKLNSRVRDIEEQLAQLKQDKEALDDLSMELELADEDELVLYRVGEAFLHIPLSKAHKHLTRDQESLDAEIGRLRDGAEDCEKTMKELKVALYAKFGKAINLDV